MQHFTKPASTGWRASDDAEGRLSIVVTSNEDTELSSLVRNEAKEWPEYVRPLTSELTGRVLCVNSGTRYRMERILTVSFAVTGDIAEDQRILAWLQILMTGWWCHWFLWREGWSQEFNRFRTSGLLDVKTHLGDWWRIWRRLHICGTPSCVALIAASCKGRRILMSK